MSTTAFDIVRGVSDSLQFEEILRQKYNEELASESSEQRNIDPKQIETGSGTVEITGFMVPSSLADLLNETPNPDRNGLILLWSYNISKIFNHRPEPIALVLRHIYNLGEKSYSAASVSSGSGRGRKKKDQQPPQGDTSEDVGFNIKPEDIGFTDRKRPESLMGISENEYEKLYRFVSVCMLPSIDAFQKRWSAGIINKTVNFQNIALNLFKGTREISLVIEQ